jgi:hypothetical protein
MPSWLWSNAPRLFASNFGGAAKYGCYWGLDESAGAAHVPKRLPPVLSSGAGGCVWPPLSLASRHTWGTLKGKGGLELHRSEANKQDSHPSAPHGRDDLLDRPGIDPPVLQQCDQRALIGVLRGRAVHIIWIGRGVADLISVPTPHDTQHAFLHHPLPLSTHLTRTAPRARNPPAAVRVFVACWRVGSPWHPSHERYCNEHPQDHYHP